MMTFPFTGKFKVTAIFGASDQELWANNGHEGIDFASQGDKTIVSVTEGTVGWVKRSNKGFGNHVWVKNDDGYGCIYAHMSSILVKAGDKVGAGTALGIQGATGNVTGPHLHFEVHASHTFYYHRDLINPAN
jgi:murein DD-endopeptidase MepM/ murein hydrolase activator NlpD